MSEDSKTNFDLNKALARLQEITDQMDSSDSDIDTLLKLYEEAKILIELCKNKIENVKLKFSEINQQYNNTEKDLEQT